MPRGAYIRSARVRNNPSREGFRAAHVRIGTAGWSVSRDPSKFPAEGSHLQRYAARFNCAEVNSSFYRPHRASTYARWSSEVPPTFRFSVKLPREITHTNRLIDSHAQLQEFAQQISALGERLGCVLVQFPPSLAFERATAGAFFVIANSVLSCPIACEPRHESWFTTDADSVFAANRIARVAADPARVPAAAVPGGWNGFVYYRLHGSPRMYYSQYATSYIRSIASQLSGAAARGSDAWCIFDNTASGAALLNASQVMEFFHRRDGETGNMRGDLDSPTSRVDADGALKMNNT